MTTATETPTPRLKTRYREEIVPALREQFEFGNPMQVPGLVKIVVNMGVGQAAKDSKLMDGAVRDLTLITGQKPLVQKARKSIAQFKLREGMPIGAKVTLRGDRMWEFLDRLLSHALPALRSIALGVQEVRPVPDLPARDGPRRRTAGRHQVFLVALTVRLARRPNPNLRGRPCCPTAHGTAARKKNNHDNDRSDRR